MENEKNFRKPHAGPAGSEHQVTHGLEKDEQTKEGGYEVGIVETPGQSGRAGARLRRENRCIHCRGHKIGLLVDRRKIGGGGGDFKTRRDLSAESRGKMHDLSNRWGLIPRCWG